MLSERLRSILNDRGISIQEFAEKCDLPFETVRNIYYGRTPDPKISTVMRMAEALNMSVNCLMGQCPHSPDEQTLIQYYRRCGYHGQSLIMLTAKYEASTARQERESHEKHLIPCLLPKNEVYQGIVYDECETIEIRTSVKEAYVALKMPDNNFVPIFCKGDIILLENRFPKHGEIGLFYIDKKAFVRKLLEEKGQYRLQSLRDHNHDIILKSLKGIEYVGTYCGVVRT